MKFELGVMFGAFGMIMIYALILLWKRVRRARSGRILCSVCQTGAELYRLDKNDGMCPYLSSYVDGKCSYYTPLVNEKSVKKLKIYQ